MTPTLDGDVLTVLARADIELSGRELARRVRHGSTEGVRRAADRLVGQGTLTRRPAGGAHLYALNRDHLSARYVEALANLRDELIDRLRGVIAAWEQPPKVALLFGSVARDDAHGASDLDLLIIRDRSIDADDDQWRTQLLDLERSATAWTGNDARIVEYAELEVGRGATERLLEDALRDGIELAGKRLTLRRLVSRRPPAR